MPNFSAVPRVTFVHFFCYVHFSWLVDLDLLCIFSYHLEVLKNVKLILFLMFGRTTIIFCQGYSIDVRFFSLSWEFRLNWFVSVLYKITLCWKGILKIGQSCIEHFTYQYQSPFCFQNHRINKNIYSK